MALLRAKPHEIPPDAILLSEEDALEYQMKVIRGWKNGSDVSVCNRVYFTKIHTFLSQVRN